MFTIIPAIDLKGGKCVRLRQGRADDAKAYSDDPVAMARQWAAQGAEYLHVVDLDGAFEGRPAHTEVIRAIIRAISIPVEVGGGIRTDEHIRALVDAGADRVILGTRAYAEPDELARLAKVFGPRLAVGIDARNSMVQVRGWVETTELTAAALARQAGESGLEWLIYTDTSRDGMLGGPNLKANADVCDQTRCRVIASGGVSTTDDIRRLRALNRANLAGAIVGKALYEGLSTLPDLLSAAAEPAPAALPGHAP